MKIESLPRASVIFWLVIVGLVLIIFWGLSTIISNETRPETSTEAEA
jgi:cell division septal protein FtsQ